MSKAQNQFTFPFALSIGPQRSGTSWLDRYLRKRGDVCLPDGVKEIFYFDRHYERGFEFYTSHFEPNETHKLAMEISTTSFDHRDAPKRVYDSFGDNLLLLCPLRHPVLRSYSLYLHYLRYGIVHGNLQDSCRQNPQILESSRYAKNLQRWYEYYPKEKIHIVFQEELEADPTAYVERVCSALGLEFHGIEPQLLERYNVTSYSKSGVLAMTAQRTADFLRARRLYFLINFGKKLGLKPLFFGEEKPDAQKKSMPEIDREWLEDQLSGEIEALEVLIGKPIPYWHDTHERV